MERGRGLRYYLRKQKPVPVCKFCNKPAKDIDDHIKNYHKVPFDIYKLL